MRTPSLSSRSHRLPDGRLASEYEYEGESVWVCDSARDALSTIGLFAREDMEPGEKAVRIFGSTFPCIQCLGRTQEYLSGLLTHIVWEAFGLDITEGKEHASECDVPVFDFGEDAARIKASLLAYYGIDWDRDASRLPYSDFLSLLSQISETDLETVPGGLPNFTTSFAQAVYYRTAKAPKADKANKGLRKGFLDMKASLALGARKRNRIEATTSVMEEQLAAARRGA